MEVGSALQGLAFELRFSSYRGVYGMKESQMLLEPSPDTDIRQGFLPSGILRRR